MTKTSKCLDGEFLLNDENVKIIFCTFWQIQSKFWFENILEKRKRKIDESHLNVYFPSDISYATVDESQDQFKI